MRLSSVLGDSHVKLAAGVVVVGLLALGVAWQVTIGAEVAQIEAKLDETPPARRREEEQRRAQRVMEAMFEREPWRPDEEPDYPEEERKPRSWLPANPGRSDEIPLRDPGPTRWSTTAMVGVSALVGFAVLIAGLWISARLLRNAAPGSAFGSDPTDS